MNSKGGLIVLLLLGIIVGVVAFSIGLSGGALLLCLIQKNKEEYENENYK